VAAPRRNEGTARHTRAAARPYAASEEHTCSATTPKRRRDRLENSEIPHANAFDRTTGLQAPTGILLAGLRSLRAQFAPPEYDAALETVAAFIAHER
jgi:hypothetical protein